MGPKLERFKPLTKEQAAKFYGKRPIAEIPNDVLNIADRARALQGDIDRLRAQLFRARLKNTIYAAIIGAAAAEGGKVAVLALLKLFTR